MTSIKRLLPLLVSLLVLTPDIVVAKEVIESFHSDIRVLENGDMKVTETILVNAEGKQIKRGIYRDFPTRYKDHLGNNYVVGFDIVSIKRDGSTEPYHTENRSNGIRIYIGDKNRTLQRGSHEFEITYRTNRQLGFFDNHDELYWNVTGNDWAFPILKASARVMLPQSIKANEIKLHGYTGIAGSRGKQYVADVNSAAVSQFQTTALLKTKEGLTIVVSFPKGHVTEPDLTQKLTHLFKDNSGLALAVFGLLVLIAYYLFIWSRVGKDPEAGVIIPQYEPPSGYSPAAMRYINNMSYDETCFTAAVVNLAVKGFLTIEDYDGKYQLTKKEDSNNKPSWDERHLLGRLFMHASTLLLSQTNHRRIAKALFTHENTLEKDYEKNYFKTNSGFFFIGLFITLIILIIAVLSFLSGNANEAVIFLSIWLSLWSLGVCGLISNAWHAWKRANSITGYTHALGATAFAAPFVFFEFVGIHLFIKEGSLMIPVVLVTAVLINWLFYELLKAPTRAGRKLLDKLEGFKHYIDIAEKHELEYKYAGGKTPELFERILPFAIALGIEQQWARQFEDVLQQAMIDNQHYSPSWYRGSHWSPSDLSEFTRSVGSSLGSAIASSSRPPGSSSGGGFSGGGGGSSGGGGGGGGGGGW